MMISPTLKIFPQSHTEGLKFKLFQLFKKILGQKVIQF